MRIFFKDRFAFARLCSRSQRYFDVSRACNRGIALFTMAFILLSLTGTYAYYNMGVVNNDRQIFAKGHMKKSVGSLFSQNIVNRVVNIIRSGYVEAKCKDGSELPNSFVDFIRQNMLFFSDEVVQTDNQGRRTRRSTESSYVRELGGTGARDLHCFASDTELAQMKKLTLSIHVTNFANYNNVVAVKLAGEAYLEPVAKAVRRAADRAVKFQESYEFSLFSPSVSSFGFVFHKPSSSINGGKLINIQGSNDKVIFNTPVFIHDPNVKDGAKNIDSLTKIIAPTQNSGESPAWNNQITFLDDVYTNAYSMDFSEIEKDQAGGLSRFMGTFTKGITTGYLTEKREKLKEFFLMAEGEGGYEDTVGGRDCIVERGEITKTTYFPSDKNHIYARKELCDGADNYIALLSGQSVTINFAKYKEDGTNPNVYNFCGMISGGGVMTIYGNGNFGSNTKVNFYGTFLTGAVNIYDLKGATLTFYDQGNPEAPTEASISDASLRDHYFTRFFRFPFVESALSNNQLFDKAKKFESNRNNGCQPQSNDDFEGGIETLMSGNAGSQESVYIIR